MAMCEDSLPIRLAPQVSDERRTRGSDSSATRRVMEFFVAQRRF
jgi:hypothetical protein